MGCGRVWRLKQEIRVQKSFSFCSQIEILISDLHNHIRRTLYSLQGWLEALLSLAIHLCKS